MTLEQLCWYYNALVSRYILQRPTLVMTAAEKEKDMEDKRTYKEAFDDFDWNKNGTIPTRVINFPYLNIQYWGYMA